MRHTLSHNVAEKYAKRVADGGRISLLLLAFEDVRIAGNWSGDLIHCGC
jgi:hypothetical protein